VQMGNTRNAAKLNWDKPNVDNVDEWTFSLWTPPGSVLAAEGKVFGTPYICIVCQRDMELLGLAMYLSLHI
jgi:hypothetical protein